MKASDIANALAYGYWQPHTHTIIPNVIESLGEMDLAVVTNAMWLHEVEIKISLSDFKREFETKARKHRCLVEGITKGGRGTTTPTIVPHTIKHFWFAMPVDLAERVASEGLVPEHAGLLAVDNSRMRRSVSVAKPAPKLKMARKLTTDEYIALLRKAYHRYWNTRGDAFLKHEEIAEVA